MAIYTVGGRDVGTYIRQEVADDVEPYEYTDTVVNNAIAQAARWYSEMRPYEKSGSFTTVADQGLYELPSDAMRVTELHYKIENTDDFYDQYGDVYPLAFTDYDSESLTIIRDKLIQAYEKHAHYFWQQVTSLTSYKAGRFVILYPEPGNSGDTVTYLYTREHTLSGTDYPTIPWEDADQFITLVVVALDRRELARMKRAPARYRDGQTEVDRRASLDTMRVDIDNRWQEIRDALSGANIERGR